MTSPLLVMLLAASPLSGGRWLLEVGGTPAGVVSVQVTPTEVVYASRLFFPGRERARTVRLAIDDAGHTAGGLVPQVAWLARRPPPGCVDTVEELSGRTETVCLAPDRAHGTLAGRPFTARWSPADRLLEFALPGARFVATDAPVAPPDEDAFAHGYDVTGQGPQPTLTPTVAGLRTPRVEAVGSPDEVEPGGCLAAARARLQRHGGELALGVVLEDGRAWPHAWVREPGSGRDVDPSVQPGDAALPRRRYLAFPPAEAGRLYLELLGGTRRVQWSSGAP